MIALLRQINRDLGVVIVVDLLAAGLFLIYVLVRANIYHQPLELRVIEFQNIGQTVADIKETLELQEREENAKDVRFAKAKAAKIND